MGSVCGGRFISLPTCKRLGPLAVSVGLPPVLILPVDDVQDVSALERDAQLVARDVEVVVGVVVEVRAEVELGEGERGGKGGD